jgi:hypothetical protein
VFSNFRRASSECFSGAVSGLVDAVRQSYPTGHRDLLYAYRHGSQYLCDAKSRHLSRGSDLRLLRLTMDGLLDRHIWGATPCIEDVALCEKAMRQARWCSQWARLEGSSRRSAISSLTARIDASMRFRASGDSSSITPRMPETSLSIVTAICFSSIMLNLRAVLTSYNN